MATQLGELVFKITGDNSGMKKSLKESETAANSTASTFKKAALSLGAFFAVDKVISFSKYLINSASDAQETAQKFGVVYSKVTTEANKMAESIAGSYNISTSATKEYLASTGQVLSSFGFEQDAALQYSAQLTKLASDMVSFSNYQGGVAGASSALTKALLGEREALKELGLVISEQDLKDYAKQQNLVWESLDRRAQAELTLSMIMDKTKLQQGDVARSAGSYAFELRKLEKNLDNISVLMGSQMLKNITPLITAFAEITEYTGAFSVALETLTPSWTDFAAPFMLTQKPLFSALNRFTGFLDSYLEKIETYKKANDALKKLTSFGGVPEAPKKYSVYDAPDVAGVPKSKPKSTPKSEGGSKPSGGGKAAPIEEDIDYDVLNEYTAQIAAVQYQLGMLGSDALDTWNKLSPTDKLTASINAATGALSIMQDGLSAVGELSSAIFASMMEDLEAQRLAELEAAGVKEETAVETAQSAYDAAVKGGDAELIKEKKRVLDREKINEKYQKKKNQLEYEAAVVAWDIQMASAVATSAMAVLNAFAAGSKFGPVVAGIYAGIAGAFGAMQVGAVALAKPSPPKYETGGIVPGSSFSGDTNMARVNSGEMIINTKDQNSLWEFIKGGASSGSTIHLTVNLGAEKFFETITQAVRDREIIIDSGSVV